MIRPGPVKDLLSGPWIGHPVHPMLTDVPIGAWMSALVADVTGHDDAARTLIGAGVLAAIPTAVTGLNDLSDTTDKPARALGVAHALGNSTALTLFASSWFARKRGNVGTGRALSFGAAAIAMGSAFLGGHLVYRRGLGVDNTAFDSDVSAWTAVLRDEELIEAHPRKVTVKNTDVLLYRAKDQVYALANRCTHRGGPLHKGRIEGDTVMCPWHLSCFRLDDGSIVRGPATAPQRVFEARVRDGNVEIRTPQRSS
ncbi:MAG: Rieske 2Fe-2S domain-containing protein [Actinomycetota bacterium]